MKNRKVFKDVQCYIELMTLPPKVTNWSKSRIDHWLNNLLDEYGKVRYNKIKLL
jgi:hypothetical protein